MTSRLVVVKRGSSADEARPPHGNPHRATSASDAVLDVRGRPAEAGADRDTRGPADTAADRLRVAEDRDGTFDPLGEQFSLGRPVTVGGVEFLVSADQTADAGTAASRPAGRGELILDVARELGATVAGFSAQLISKWGEPVTVDADEVPRAVPVGRYRLDGLKLKLADADGRIWSYDFYGTDGYTLTVEKGRPTAFNATAGLKATARLSRASVAAGGSFDVSPEVTTAGGLTLRACERLDKFSDRGLGVEAVVALERPGSEAVCEVRSGFT